MRCEDILLRAIKKAKEHGFTWSEDIEGMSMTRLSEYIDKNRHYNLIFSHKFCKAFWGEKAWIYNIKQMALHEDRLRYIERFL